MSNNIFERYMFEAPEDEAPPDEAPADEPVETPADDDTPPPDMDDGGGDDAGGYDDDAPPDMMGDDEAFGDEEPEDPNQDLKVDEKISSIMNVHLYQTFLTLVTDINEQIVTIKNNTDMFYSLSNESLEIIAPLKKLNENIRLYLKNNFVGERYEKNLLFFNKCMNLYKLLGDKFNAQISKGIKHHD